MKCSHFATFETREALATLAQNWLFPVNQTGAPHSTRLTPTGRGEPPPA